MKILGTFQAGAFTIHAFDTECLGTSNRIDVDVDGLDGHPVGIVFRRESATQWLARVEVANAAFPPYEETARHFAEAIMAATQHAAYLEAGSDMLEAFYQEGLSQKAQAYEASVAHDPPLGEKGAQALVSVVRSMLRSPKGRNRRFTSVSIMTYPRGSFVGTEYECYTVFGNRVQWRNAATRAKVPENKLASLLASCSQRSCLREVSDH